MTIAPPGAALTLRQLGRAVDGFTSTPAMPALFLGHGSPMNAIQENSFTHGWRTVAKDLPAPNAILCISALWETTGTFVTGMGKAFQRSIPTPEHYLPLLYTLGLKDRNEAVSIFHDRTVMGSISMTSIRIG
jgi:aromatic ring-opening dioxygenase catalytic subunit (LigB family)